MVIKKLDNTVSDRNRRLFLCQTCCDYIAYLFIVKYIIIKLVKKQSFLGVKSPISQYFRRVIAKEIKLEDKYDYKRYSFKHNVLNTLFMLDKNKKIA